MEIEVQMLRNICISTRAPQKALATPILDEPTTLLGLKFSVSMAHIRVHIAWEMFAIKQATAVIGLHANEALKWRGFFVAWTNTPEVQSML